MKSLTMVLTFLTLTFVLVACGESNNTTKDVPDEDLGTFTLAELAAFDGLDGRDAYIAVDGFVYDVTQSVRWREGLHQGTYQAGADLSVEINSSPHGRRVLDQVPRIGELVEE